MAKAILVIFFFVAFIAIFGYFLKLRVDEIDIQISAPAEELSSASKFDITLHSDIDHGQYLADAIGKSLYYFSSDVDGQSHCLGECLDSMTIFYRPDVRVTKFLNKSDFGEIVRPDGQRQTTWRGWPLYYYKQDMMEGSFMGDGYRDLWYLAKPDYTLMVASDGVRSYAVDRDGLTVYLSEDCDDNCQSIWPKFSFGDDLSLPSALQHLSNNLDSLHYYRGDIARGQVNGLDQDIKSSLVYPW